MPLTARSRSKGSIFAGPLAALPLLLVIAVDCSSWGTGTIGSSSPLPTRTGTGYAAGYALVEVDGVHARAIASFVNLIDAYNAGDLEGVLARLTDTSIWVDCDYRTGAATGTTRPTAKADLVAFLQDRFADHDKLAIGRIAFSSPEDVNAIGTGLGVWFASRSSDTLRALGHASGIRGPQQTKIAISPDGKIAAVSLTSTPAGDACRPVGL